MLSAQEISMLRSPDMWRVNRMTPGLGLLAKQCAVKSVGLQRVRLPPGNWFAPPGSNRSGSGGNEAVGVMATACRHRRPDATREAPAVIAVRINWQLARDRPGRVGWRRGP